jgi:hypothetical protein
MARRSSVTQLPPEVKDWLDRSLVDGGFAGYQALAAELQGRGYDISKSALHRYGQSFEEKVERLKTATEQARAVVAASPDDAGHMGEALTRLVQTQTFDLLLKLDVENIDPESINLAAVGKMVADLNKASVAQKQWAAKVREKADAAAEEVTKIAKSGGLSDEAAALIREKVLGIAS